jgi:endonuclease/exonuclease/phosphatase family metal-dependent hydrolase
MSAPFRQRLRRLARCTGVTAGVLVFLTLWNEVVLSRGTRAELGELTEVAKGALRPLEEAREVKVVAYNLAKAFVDAEFPRFPSRAATRSRLDAIAEILTREDADLVFLSEVVWETPWNSVNQVRHLATAAGYRHFAFGENVNLGLPLFRFASGNAILSRWPLSQAANPDLPGRRPFWVTRNNRRLLLAEAALGGQPVLCLSLHLDSLDSANNLRQVQRILEWVDGRPTLAAGDFNAEPGSESLLAWRNSRRFSGSVEGPKTYPSDRPERRLDYILAPSHWRELFHSTTGGTLSDHLAVVSKFQVAGPRQTAER